MPANSILTRLDGVQGKGPRWRAICPGHQSEHRTRSLSLFETDDGRLLLHCHAGCDVGQIVGALGLELSDLFPPGAEDGQHRPMRKPWRVRDVVAALKGELHLAWVILIDVKSGAPLSDPDRQRAGVAAERIVALLDELEHGC